MRITVPPPISDNPELTQWLLTAYYYLRTLPVKSAVPALSTSPGFEGEIAIDNNYLYYCISQDSWIRFAKDPLF